MDAPPLRVRATALAVSATEMEVGAVMLTAPASLVAPVTVKLPPLVIEVAVTSGAQRGVSGFGEGVLKAHYPASLPAGVLSHGTGTHL